MANGWRTLAIVFIILFILETAFLVWAMNLGTQAIENKQKCVYNTCAEYDGYYYDDTSTMCYCYTGKEIAKQEYLG